MHFCIETANQRHSQKGPGMEQFVIRPGYANGEPLIEFAGDHRSASFPQVLGLLEAQLPSFCAQGGSPAPDDYLWVCSYEGGQFELSDDWCSLFVLPTTDPGRVVERVAQALEATGQFQRTEAGPRAER